MARNPGTWNVSTITLKQGLFLLALNLAIFSSSVCFIQIFYKKCVFSNISLIGNRLYLTCNIFSLFPAGFRVASAIRTGLSSDLMRSSWSYIYLQIRSMSSQFVTTPLSMGQDNERVFRIGYSLSPMILSSFMIPVYIICSWVDSNRNLLGELFCKNITRFFSLPILSGI